MNSQLYHYLNIIFYGMVSLTLGCTSPPAVSDADLIPPSVAPPIAGAAPNQGVTPAPPPAKIFTKCGHSKYYYGRNRPGSGVVAGVEAQPNQYPWIVRIEITIGASESRCGGSIIAPNWVLTAHHCWADGVQPADITMYFGDHSDLVADSGEFTRVASEIHKHPNYSEANANLNDFMLLKFNEPLNFTDWKIQKICLPGSCADGCAEGSMVYAAGWGRLSDGGFTANELQTALLQIGSLDVCKTQHANINYRHICAGYLAGGVDTCQGDSGGPLMTMEDGYYKLCGVTSFGGTCAAPNSFGVYARVCTALGWIKSTTKITIF